MCFYVIHNRSGEEIVSETITLPFGQTRVMNRRAPTVRRKGRYMTNSETNDPAAKGGEQGANVAPKKPRSKKGATPPKTAPKRQTNAKAAKPKKGASKKASETQNPEPRPESKGAKILEMLRRAKGASLAELMKATGWQAHSVRGFISTAGKKHDVTIESSKNDAGDRMYRIAK
jgi:hypothetical protein